MKFSSNQLPDGRWGIYNGVTLLATVACPEICKTVLENLASGRHDAPTTDVNELYKAPELSRKAQNYSPVVSNLKTSKVHSKKVSKKRASKKRARKKLDKLPTAASYPSLAEGA